MCENAIWRLCALPLPLDLILKVIDRLESDPSDAPLISKLLAELTSSSDMESWERFCADFPATKRQARDIIEEQYER